jgi:ABC-2 type transport system ATP-binding protein
VITETAVEAHGVVQTFGHVRALDGLDLAVKRGEILGLVGPNGAGKTTFIRLIAGLLRPTAGEIVVLGGKPGARGVVERTGYMTQSAALYEDLTVRENLVFFGRLYGLTRTRANANAGRLEELMSLQEKRSALVRELSGGLRQRTNLACAMIHEPELLLLDEPTVGVDPVLRRSLWEHFAELNSRGTTILVTTHVMEEAERCDRVAMIASGRTMAAGTSEELRRRTNAATLEDAYLVFSSQEASA